MEKYILPDLPYGYKDLEPIMSESQLMLHHQKHHQAYVSGANKLLEKLDKAREEDKDIDLKAASKEFSFQIGGHILHSLFWKIICPEGKGGEISDGLKSKIVQDFGSFDRFMREFDANALSIEGSGWSALVLEKMSQKLMIMQIEKHNVNIFPGSKVLMLLDMFEHAYYVDHKNNKVEYVENFWKIVNWKEVNKRFDSIISKK